MSAIILSIGDELTLGQTVDTNAAWVSARLAEHGIPTYAHQTVADDRKAIELAIRWACRHADAVIISGGLGPTEDDLTRFALADVMGVGLVEDGKAIKTLEAFFRGRGRPMPQRNRVQAMRPEGATLIPNPNGTAPGIHCRIDKAEVYALPGVPREMRAMVRDDILPRTRALAGTARTILTTKINTFGMGESNVAERLGDLMDRGRNPLLGTTVTDGIVSVRVRAEYDDNAEAHRQLDDTCQLVTSTLGPIVFGRDDTTIPEALVPLMQSKRATLSTAESCTGGLIGAMMTEAPGSSEVYAGGWVTYSNRMKAAQLGVPNELLETHGAVSAPVVRAMAEGVLTRSGSTLAVSVSGIAGPGGGSPDKPVGTAWLGLAWSEDGVVRSDARVAHLPGGREAVRDRAAKCALQWARLHLMGEPVERIGWLRGE